MQHTWRDISTLKGKCSRLLPWSMLLLTVSILRLFRDPLRVLSITAHTIAPSTKTLDTPTSSYITLFVLWDDSLDAATEFLILILTSVPPLGTVVTLEPLVWAGLLVGETVTKGRLVVVLFKSRACILHFLFLLVSSHCICHGIPRALHCLRCSCSKASSQQNEHFLQSSSSESK